jgi:hypothetical protein
MLELEANWSDWLLLLNSTLALLFVHCHVLIQLTLESRDYLHLKP